MKKCKYCMSEIDDKAKICPHCGKKQKKKFGRVIGILLGVVVLFIIIGALAGGGDDADTKKQNVSDESQQVTDPVSKMSHGLLETVVEPSEGHTEYGNQIVNGTIKNVSGKTLSYVEINYAIYDSDGNQIGTAMDNITDLTDGSTWKYSAYEFADDEFVSFELTSIDAF